MSEVMNVGVMNVGQSVIIIISIIVSVIIIVIIVIVIIIIISLVSCGLYNYPFIWAMPKSSPHEL